MTPRPRARKGPLSPRAVAVAAVLNGERGACDLTYEQLAAKTGVSVRSLKRYISPTADREITLTVLGHIAEALDISFDEVFRRADQRMPPEPAPAKDAPAKKAAERTA